MLQATRRTVPVMESSAPVWQGRGLRWAVNGFFLAAAASLLLGATLFAKQWATRTEIASVQVEGVFRQVSRPEMARLLGGTVDGNYFTTDLAAIRAAALRSPWVEDAVVQRQWPDAVRVHIQEKQAVARWGDQGLISSKGELFAPLQAQGTESLPVLFGPANKARYVMEEYRAMNDILRGLGLRIVELQLTDRMSWFLRLDSGVQLVVDQMNTVAKLQRFAYLYQRQLVPDAENIQHIDLRYRNGVAVGWKMQKSANSAQPDV